MSSKLDKLKPRILIIWCTHISAQSIYILIKVFKNICSVIYSALQFSLVYWARVEGYPKRIPEQVSNKCEQTHIISRRLNILLMTIKIWSKIWLALVMIHCTVDGLINQIKAQIQYIYLISEIISSIIHCNCNINNNKTWNYYYSPPWHWCHQPPSSMAKTL